MSEKTMAGKRDLMGLAAVMRIAFRREDLAPLADALIARGQDPEDGEALMDLATVLHVAGNSDLALAVQAQALKINTLYRLPASGDAPGIRVLAFMAPGDLSANMPVEALLEGSDVELLMLYLPPGSPMPESVPDHDVAMVMMSQSEANIPMLLGLEALAPHWPRPLVNRPNRILLLSRDGAAGLFQGIAGLHMPVTTRAERGVLSAIAAGKLPLAAVLDPGDYPLIVRPMDSHAGHDLARIDDAAELARYLNSAPGGQFYVAPFVDYRSRDGLYRKYRVVMIEGVPYAGHMAISSHWMIHYLNAGMDDDAAKRQEEARWMADFDGDFAVRHGAALAAMHERLGLEYFGVDCAEMPDGRLLVFEADHAMIVHAMDPPAVYPYKQAPMARVFAAFRKLLEDSRSP